MNTKLKMQYNYIMDLSNAGIITENVKNEQIKILKNRENALKRYQNFVVQNIQKQAVLNYRKKSEKKTENQANSKKKEPSVSNNVVKQVLQKQ